MKAFIVLVACMAFVGLPRWIYAADKYLVIPTTTPTRYQPIEDAGTFSAVASNGVTDIEEMGEIDEVVCFLTSQALKGDTNNCNTFSTNGCAVQKFTYGWYLRAYSCPGSTVACAAMCIKR